MGFYLQAEKALRNYLTLRSASNFMRKSEIKLNITLDTHNIPTEILWEATDNPDGGLQKTKAFALAIWEEETGSVLKIDLWDKNMMVGEMKAFMIQTLGGIGETLFNATGDQYMKTELDNLCAKFSQHVIEEEKAKKL